jgi:hypothetical protein
MMNRPLFALCLLAVAGSAVAQAAPHVAGLQPDRRPDGAPQLAQAAPEPAQLQQSLRGVERPVPGNVESIAATGRWWVPLRAPGMTPPYDLRHWHAPTSGSAAGAAAPASR